MDPWNWFDLAISGEADLHSALASALEGVNASDLGSEAQRAELKASIISVQSEIGTAGLKDALSAVAISNTYVRTDWLAELLLRKGRTCPERIGDCPGSTRANSAGILR